MVKSPESEQAARRSAAWDRQESGVSVSQNVSRSPRVKFGASYLERVVVHSEVVFLNLES